MSDVKYYGALFRNSRKSSDEQPDYTGVAEFGSSKLQIFGRIKTSKAGSAYMSLTFLPSVEAGAQAAVPEGVAAAEPAGFTPF